MLNELKKESLKKVLAWVVLWAVVAAGCFVYALPGVFAMLSGAKELGSLSAEKLEGRAAEQFHHPHPAVQLHHRQKCDGFRYDH